MKKHLPTIVSILSCVLVVVCLVQIASLEQQMTRLRNSVSNDLSDIRSNVSSIHSTISEKLAEEANLLSASEWAFGEIDIDGRTADVHCTIAPKVYNPDSTVATMICNDKEYPMAYGNGQYTATIPIPLFENSLFAQVQLEDDGTIRSQRLNWNLNPRYEALLNVYASAAAGGPVSVSPSREEEAAYWRRVDFVEITIERKGGFGIQSVEIVEELDGVEIGRLPVDISKEGQTQYREGIFSHGMPEPESSLHSGTTQSGSAQYGSLAHFYYQLEKEYPVPNGSMLAVYVDVVDDHGFRYRSVADCWAVSADGQADDLRMERVKMYESAEPIYIYDAEGNVVFAIDEELYR